MTMPFQTVPQTGWICPVCGRGNAPFNPTCVCNGQPVKAIMTTDTAPCIHTWAHTTGGLYCLSCNARLPLSELPG